MNQTIEYYGKILSDGHLSIDKKTKKELELQEGSVLKVILIKECQGKITVNPNLTDFEKTLAEGYAVNSDRDENVAEEFRFVNAENLPDEY